MKKVKYPNLSDYDLSAYEELKGDILYRINGGTEIENSNDAVANAKVGDTLTRSNGEVVVITEEHIQWARDHGGKVLEGMDDGTPNSGDDGGSCVEPEVYGFESPQVTVDTRVIRDRDVKGVSSSPLINDILKKLRKAAHERLGAGKPFDSIEDAAKAWAMTYADDSIFYMREFGSTIYSFEIEEIKDGKKRVVTKYSYNIPNCSKSGQFDKVELNTTLLPGQTAVSAIHSHGNYNLAGYQRPFIEQLDAPSETDIKGVRDAGYKCEYLVTPLGRLYSFDGEGTVGVVNTVFPLPTDPWADYPYCDIRNEQRRLNNSFYPDPYIDEFGRIN